MVVRQSSDHHAERIVEELLRSGEIKTFPYPVNFNESYFDDHDPEDPMDTVRNGFRKKQLIDLTKNLLDFEGILPKTNATTETFADERYFDCMSPELEARLLDASRTFMALMYQQTPMLQQAAAASFSSKIGRAHV